MTNPTPFEYNDDVKRILYSSWNGQEKDDWQKYGGDKYWSYLKQGGTPFGPMTPLNASITAKAQAELAAEKRQAAIQPAIQSLESTRPEIEKAYETETNRLTGEKTSLTDRYKLLLDDITNREKKVADSATLKTNNELAKRGISSDSGMAQNELFNVLSPITAEYGNLKKQTALDQEDLIRGINDAITGLVPKKTADLRGITQAIADLQAGTGNKSVDDYLGAIQQGFTNSLAERQFQETLRSNKVQEELARLGSGGGAFDNFIKLGEGDTLFDLLSGRTVTSIPKTYKSTASAAGGGSWY